LTECYKTPKLKTFYENTCDLVTVDGRPLVYLSNILFRSPLPEMVGGPNLWNQILIKFNTHRFYFLGSKETTLVKAINNIQTNNKHIKIVGHHHGFFDINGNEFMKILNEIDDLLPDFIYIGMPSPQKELVAERIKTQFRKRPVVIVIIGGAFDYLSGEKKIGNSIISRLCLDWLLRLVQEPKRLFFRYLKSNSFFLFLIIKKVFLRR